MDINQAIREHSSQPLTHQLMMSFLKDYRRPNDKIKTLRAEGILESIKKGLYIAGPNIRASKPERGLLANHIYGPSYVSLEIALSYYGLIPERVYETASMTTKSSKEFNTPAGIFTYTHSPLPYYAFGLSMVRLAEDQHTIFASPEKALCDKIVSTSGILLRSITQVTAYLLEDLRIEKPSLKNFDIKKMESWVSNAPKSDSLNMLIKMIKNL